MFLYQCHSSCYYKLEPVINSFDLLLFCFNQISHSFFSSLSSLSAEHVRLVGGASRCAGQLQVKQGEWKPLDWPKCNLKTASVVCRQLDCGNVVSIAQRELSKSAFNWYIKDECLEFGFNLSECAALQYTSDVTEITCSGKSITDICKKKKKKASTLTGKHEMCSSNELNVCFTHTQAIFL